MTGQLCSGNLCQNKQGDEESFFFGCSPGVPEAICNAVLPSDIPTMTSIGIVTLIALLIVAGVIKLKGLFAKSL